MSTCFFFFSPIFTLFNCYLVLSKAISATHSRSSTFTSCQATPLRLFHHLIGLQFLKHYNQVSTYRITISRVPIQLTLCRGLGAKKKKNKESCQTLLASAFGVELMRTNKKKKSTQIDLVCPRVSSNTRRKFSAC